LPANVLESYEQERKPHSRNLIQLALGVGRAMTAGGEFGDLIRRVVVPLLHRLPGISAKVLDSRTPALHRSTMVHKTRAPRQLAGTLCPNPLVAGEQRLDATLGNGFAIVTTVTPGPAERALAEQRGAVIQLAAPGTELARWLHRGRAKAAILRPDRAVMRTGRAPGALCDALPPFAAKANPTTRVSE
jgi:3-(3-hydroxy-phenyl)propionate hydroxylase